MTVTGRWLALCVALGFAVRLAFGLVYWVDKPLTHDEREYLALARSVARGDGFTYPADEPAEGTSQRFGRAPGYPAFLSVLRVTAPVDAVPTRVKVAQSAVGAMGIWLLALIAWRCAGPRAAIAAAAVAAVYPPLVWMPAYALSETLYSTLAVAAALALTPAREVRGTTREGGAARSDAAGAARSAQAPRHPLPGALLTAAAVLVRPAMIVFVPLAAVWIWRSRHIVAAIVFIVAIAACLAPWTFRNHRVYGRWIAIASEGGVTFWTGNHPLATGDGDLAANPALKEADVAFRRAHPGLTAEQLEPMYYRDAFAWMRGHPGAWLSLELRKAFYTVLPFGPSYRLHSSRYVLASVGAYLLILPAAIVGGVRCRRLPAALWLMAAATVLAGLVFFPQERFRIPVIDPALIVSAAMLAALPAHERTRRLSDV